MRKRKGERERERKRGREREREREVDDEQTKEGGVKSSQLHVCHAFENKSSFGTLFNLMLKLSLTNTQKF